MNRDILKTLLGGLLILLLGCLIVYVIFQRDKISAWIKNQQASSNEQAPNERVIIGLDEVQPSKELPPPTQNFDSEFAPPKETGNEISKPLPKTDYEVPGLGPEKGKSKGTDRHDEATGKRESSREEYPEVNQPLPKSKRPMEFKGGEEETPKKSERVARKHRKHSYKKKKPHAGRMQTRLHSLEKRVNRLEKKLGVKSDKAVRAKKNLPLEKRVERLEKEMSTLKKKSKEE
ncbi:putative lipoprotein [Leptospira fainei serovar Hurstbridge str. BUT 6]|uniref:Lipoprotein n=1 Tax=Leptospira fainei serovar Hurstbridge str. BUT 6 TaxID=1193011 RepID=S3V3X7_9LEPT|nr:lipoprotein [Leptospira fainei]EPG76118.1 putative lipoprotein [Leptospira fainei serovar Hurstbridge str. BUT 6]